MRQAIKFLYRLLFIDDTNHVSHTKFWSNVGYACLCFTFVYAVMYGTTVDVMIWALFGVVVIGNRTLVYLFNKDTRPESPPVNNDEPPKESQ